MLKVLHIEDDTDNRRLVRKLLVANGFEVVEASDALSGIRKALSSEPDIILLDIERAGTRRSSPASRPATPRAGSSAPSSASTSASARTGSSSSCPT